MGGASRWLAHGMLLHGVCMLAAAAMFDASTEWVPAGGWQSEELDSLLTVMFGALQDMVWPVLGMGIVSLLAGGLLRIRSQVARWSGHVAVALHLPGLLWCTWRLDAALVEAGLSASIVMLVGAVSASSSLLMVVVGWVAIERFWRGSAASADGHAASRLRL